MWWAPKAEDWQRPCLIQWQRTMADAIAVSKQTGKPILVCVNMDGEIASEHYAGVRYRQPEIAKLYEPYVCVIASVYRHNPRDYDEQGRRILCPRFGGVTCGEHIAIEPGLYSQYFEGQRVAPRHIGVELDSQEMFDVYYAFDTDTIFNTLREGVAGRPPVPPLLRGDRPLVERVASPDHEDRTAVEAAFAQGDRAEQRRLLEATVALGDAASVDVLRLALCSFDLELNQLARRALAQTNSASAIDVILEALRVPLAASERQALVGALARLGATSPRARMLAVVHQGLADASSAIDAPAWVAALAPTQPPVLADRDGLEAQLARYERAPTAGSNAAEAQLDLAEATLAYASAANSSGKHARLLFEDAQRAVQRAESLGASGWRLAASRAAAAYNLGNLDEANAQAAIAVKGMPAGAPGPIAALVLSLFAEARRQAIYHAARAKTDWPSSWLADAHAAFSVLARHPAGTDLQVAAHHDLLKHMGAAGQATQVLDVGLARFPDSWSMHERLRARLLEEKGLAGLEAYYDARLGDGSASPTLRWFAGYASLVTAEFHKTAGRDAEALAAYDRAVAHYEAGVQVNPDSQSSADHYVALAFAGRARLAYEHGDHARALEQLLASFDRKPDAAATEDGLARSPMSTARLLRTKLVEAQQTDMVAQLDAALAKLDPELLLLPASERQGPPERGRGRRRRG